MSSLRVLLVNDYGLDTEGGGGHVRIRQLYGQMAASGFDVTLLCFTDSETHTETRFSDNFRQIAVPKTAAHRHLQSSIDAFHPHSAADVVSLLCCTENQALEQVFRACSAASDVIVFEHVYMAPLLAIVPDGRSVVYEAQNVERNLKTQILGSHPYAAELLDAVQAAEEEIVQSVHAIISVSSEDASCFRSEAPGKAVHVIENGVSVQPGSAFSWHGGTDARAIFAGSGHPPNVEAMEFIVSSLAPALPEISFVILGSVCEYADRSRMPANVKLAGFVDEAAKREYLQSSAIALNPMSSGGGSNLKVPEYFAAGVPVLSTPIGARGFNVTDGVHLRLAPLDDFSVALREFLSDASTRQTMARTAFEYVRENLGWDRLADRLSAVLRSLNAN